MIVLASDRRADRQLLDMIGLEFAWYRPMWTRARAVEQPEAT